MQLQTSMSTSKGNIDFFFLQHDFYLKAVVIDCDFTYKAYDPFLKSNEML